jgi:DNA polymerase III delta subunit
MAYFLYGSNQKDLKDFIKKYKDKNDFLTKEFEVSEENLEEILISILSESLFGEKFLYIIDITNSSEETIFSLSKRLKKESKENSTNVIVQYSDDLISRSKILTSFDGFTYENFENEKPEIYKLVDLIISGNLKEVYTEITRLGISNVDEIHIFNLVVSGFRSIEYFCLDLDQKKSVLPFKKNFYEKLSGRYTASEIKNISQKLFEMDLKFKTGELTEDMVLTSLILLFHKL